VRRFISTSSGHESFSFNFVHATFFADVWISDFFGMKMSKTITFVKVKVCVYSHEKVQGLINRHGNEGGVRECDIHSCTLHSLGGMNSFSQQKGIYRVCQRKEVTKDP
jgi:hypothetical protein